MSQLKIPNSTIDEIIAADAYEARMHFLKPDGSPFGAYQTWPGMVSEPTVEAAQEELPFREHPGFLMWVDFKEVGIKRGLNNAMGRIAIATYPNELECYEEVLKSPQENSFIKLWLGRYAMDRTRNFYGDHRHPIWDVGSLYAKLDIRGDLEEVQRRAKQEKWDPRIDKKQWYVASLARKAKEDFPELFKGEDSWQKRMGIRLRSKSLLPQQKLQIDPGNLRPFRFVSDDAVQVNIEFENESEKSALIFSSRKLIGDQVLWKFDGIQSINHEERDPLKLSFHADANYDTEILAKELEKELEEIRTARAVKALSLNPSQKLK